MLVSRAKVYVKVLIYEAIIAAYCAHVAETSIVHCLRYDYSIRWVISMTRVVRIAPKIFGTFGYRDMAIRIVLNDMLNLLGSIRDTCRSIG